MKKNLLLTFISLTMVLPALAYNFHDEESGLYFNITSEEGEVSTVEVTYPNDSQPNSSSNPSEYSGTSYTIPDYVSYKGLTYAVTAIGDRAFYRCSGLTEVTIGNNVTTIGNYAFYICASLEGKLTIPDNVTTIGSCAYYSCTSLTSVTIGSSVETIGRQAFYGCTSLTSLTIGGNVTTMGTEAFASCSNLTSVTMGDNVTTIGDDAFEYCTSLTSVTIPASVTTIGDAAFYKCTSLTSVTFGSGLETIGNYAFEGCTSLTSVTIPASVTTIGDIAFEGCTSLQTFVVDEKNQYYSSNEYGVLFNKDKTTLICYPAGSEATTYTIPESVTIIEWDAFSACSNLTSVTIGCSVETIGFYAFYNCTNLTSVTIGSNVETIEEYAFFGCTSLDSVTTLNPTPPYLNGSFVFSYCSTTVYVPAGTIDEYKNKWGNNPDGVSGYAELDYAVIKIEASEGYATYYNKDYDVTMPKGVMACVATDMSIDETDGCTICLNRVKNGLVPAGTPVVIKGAVGTYLYVDVSEPTSTTSYDNMLYGNSTTGNTSVDGATSGYRFYKLTRNSADEVGSMGFYWGANNGDSFSIPGNKAWLAIPQSEFYGFSPTSLSIKIGGEDDFTTGISSVESTSDRSVSGIYTLQGVRVSDMSRKGVYIVDGKKVVKR